MPPVKVNGAGKATHKKSVGEALRIEGKSNREGQQRAKEELKRLQKMQQLEKEREQRRQTIIATLPEKSKRFFDSLDSNDQLAVLISLNFAYKLLKKLQMDPDNKDKCFFTIAKHEGYALELEQTLKGQGWTLLSVPATSRTFCIGIFVCLKDDHDKIVYNRFCALLGSRLSSYREAVLENPYTLKEKIESMGDSFLKWLGIRKYDWDKIRPERMLDDVDPLFKEE